MYNSLVGTQNVLVGSDLFVCIKADHISKTASYNLKGIEVNAVSNVKV